MCADTPDKFRVMEFDENFCFSSSLNLAVSLNDFPGAMQQAVPWSPLLRPVLIK